MCTRSRRPLLADDATHQLLHNVWSTSTAWLVGQYVLMPDHVHLLAAPGMPDLPLTNWVSFWKRAFTRLRGESIWQGNYWDTTIRSPAHWREIWDYVEQNPVRRGLATSAERWPFRGELNPIERR